MAKLLFGELLIHMALEEALFYPQVRKAIREKDSIEEGEQEHDEDKDLILALGDIDHASPDFDEKMQKLFDGISSHVAEEEKELFPRVRHSKLNLEKLGRDVRDAMRANLGLPPET